MTKEIRLFEFQTVPGIFHETLITYTILKTKQICDIQSDETMNLYMLTNHIVVEIDMESS